MKVMVIVKATADSEAGVLPDQDLLTAMGRFNEDLVNAGVMLAGEGLKPTAADGVFDAGVRRGIDFDDLGDRHGGTPRMDRQDAGTAGYALAVKIAE